MIDDCSDLEDLDQLDPKEFKDDESDDDDRDMYKILDDKGLLGSLEEEKQEKGHGGLGEEKHTKKGKASQNKDTDKDKKLLGHFFIALKQMRKAAKLNHHIGPYSKICTEET